MNKNKSTIWWIALIVMVFGFMFGRLSVILLGLILMMVSFTESKRNKNGNKKQD